MGGQRLAWAVGNDPVHIGLGADLDWCVKSRPYTEFDPLTVHPVEQMKARFPLKVY